MCKNYPGTQGGLRVDEGRQGMAGRRGTVAAVCLLALLLILFALTDYLTYTARRTRERYEQIVGDWTQNAALVLQTQVRGGQEALFACALHLAQAEDLQSAAALEGLGALVRRGNLFDSAGLLI